VAQLVLGGERRKVHTVVAEEAPQLLVVQPQNSPPRLPALLLVLVDKMRDKVLQQASHSSARHN
jgi:hypothetical protein